MEKTLNPSRLKHKLNYGCFESYYFSIFHNVQRLESENSFEKGYNISSTIKIQSPPIKNHNTMLY